MQFISQGATLLDDDPNIIKQLGNRARICYRTECQDDETALVRFIIKRGHNSCLEMARITIKTNLAYGSATSVCFGTSLWPPVPYLDIRCKTITASPRVFRAIWAILTPRVQCLLKRKYPVLFEDKEAEGESFYNGIKGPLCVNHDSVSVVEDTLDYYQAIEIVTSRSVTHELVRHRPASFLQQSQRYVDYSGSGLDFIQLAAGKYASKSQKIIEYLENAEAFYRELRAEKYTPEIARIILPNQTATKIIVYTSLRHWQHILALRDSPKADIYMRELMGDHVAPLLRGKFPGVFDNCTPIP